MSSITDEQREEALRILRKDYWDDVRSIADETRAAIRRGEITTVESVDTYVHGYCDGHARVIYTHQAIETLLFCESEDDAIEACVLDNLKTPQEIYSCLAFWGLRGDVLKTLGNLEDLFTSEEE